MNLIGSSQMFQIQRKRICTLFFSVRIQESKNRGSFLGKQREKIFLVNVRTASRSIDMKRTTHPISEVIRAPWSVRNGRGSD